MSIVTGYDDQGNPIISTLGGVGISSDADRANAVILDDIIKKEIKKLTRKLKSKGKKYKKGTKEKGALYWKLGDVLRGIYIKSGLVKPAELLLFYKNVKLHLPEEYDAKDRGPERMHLSYCMRLAGFNKKKVERLKWSEWVELFDRNQDARFDLWFDRKIEEEPENMTREYIRLSNKCRNALLKNIETTDLSEEELYRIYDYSWELARIIINEYGKEKYKQFEKIALENRELVGYIMDNKITKEEYLKKIIDKYVK